MTDNKNEIINPFDSDKDKSVEFNYTTADVEKCKDDLSFNKIIDATRIEIKRLEATRKKNETVQEKQKLNSEIYVVKRVGSLARNRLYNKRMEEKKDKNKNSISKLEMKKGNFVRLIRKGISLTNILDHPNGISKKEILDVVTPEVIKTISGFQKDFPIRFELWKKKYKDIIG